MSPAVYEKMAELVARVFRNGTPFFKDPRYYTSFNLSEALPLITDPNKHKIRHSIVRPLFSKRCVDNFAPNIEEIVERALRKVAKFQETGKPLNIQQLFRCMTVGISFLRRKWFCC